jgi:general secretion pathway protein B
MSLILDALRKSEHERQREAGPALATVPESRTERRTPKWLPALVVLLALNIVVLAAVLWRHSGPAAGPATVPVTSAPAPAVAPPEPAPQGASGPAGAATVATPLPLPEKPPRHEVRPLTTELPPAAPAPSAAAARQAGGDSAAASAGSAPAATATPGDSTATATEDARLPRFADLVVRGELNVPHMHLDIHVYSGDPAERFVFINMRRYNEGNATQEGPKVERITRSGVVMSHQGQRFLLTRD